MFQREALFFFEKKNQKTFIRPMNIGKETA